MPSFKASSLPDLSQKVFIVTGGNGGIGYHTVVELVRHGATVYLGTRSSSKGTTAMQSIKSIVPNADIRILELDLADLKSTVAAAKYFLSKETALHGLINNAGIMGVKLEMTSDGYESQFQTNYLSHWLLTSYLLPILCKTATGASPGSVRIVNVSSSGHDLVAPPAGIDFNDINQLNGDQWTRYGQSKLANILHAKELNRRYGPSSAEPGQIWTASVHPGLVHTNLAEAAQGNLLVSVLRTVAPFLRALSVGKEPAEGALTSLYAAASPEFGPGDSGKYFVPIAKVGKPSSKAEDSALALELWEWTETKMKDAGYVE